MGAKLKRVRHSPEREGCQPSGRWGFPRDVPVGPGRATQLGKLDRCALLRDSASAGNEALTEKLLDAGAQVDAHDKDGNTALMLASRNGHVDVVRTLLARGADPSARNNKGDSAMCWTTDSGCMELCDDETARVLKAFGAD